MNPNLVALDIEFELEPGVGAGGGRREAGQPVRARVICDGDSVQFTHPQTGLRWFCDREPLAAVVCRQQLPQTAR